MKHDINATPNAKGPDESSSAETLLSDVYEELRSLAYSKMMMESGSHTLQPTALVHEAWLRMAKPEDYVWKNRSCFIAAAAQAMRRILVDHARRKSRVKRGGDAVRIPLDDLELADPSQQGEVVLMVDDALKYLENLFPDGATVVEMKFYGGMTNKEVAEAMGISEAKVERHWTFAKAWLHDKISKTD